MISHKYKCIFIHIPKCAGTSIEDALGHLDGHDGRAGQDHRSLRMIQKPFPPVNALSNLDNIKDSIRRFREYVRPHSNPNNALQVTKSQYEEYYKFTAVRHPVDRAYSWYKNAMRDEIHQKNYGIDKNLSFHEFMKKFTGKGFLRPQVYWLKDYKGALNYDRIIKFETLLEDFTLVAEELGLENPRLPHKISGGDESKKPDIDDKTIAFIESFYQEDYNFLGYA
jgi:hypothetical protein